MDQRRPDDMHGYDRASLERALADQIDESERLRELARAMADAEDTHGLLNVLTQHASEQCNADAATVARVVDGVAEVIAAAGEAVGFLGFKFSTSESLTARVIRDRVTLSDDDYSTRPDRVDTTEIAAEIRPRFVAGPVIITPLMTQNEVIGVLGVMRAVGGIRFTARDERRLEVLADYTSVALKKSRLFEAAQAANQAKSTFLATMSHELRTPLTALTGYGELLADEIVGPLTPLQHDTVERMRAVTNHLTVMIDEILTFSSIEAGREKVVFSTISAAALLHSAAAVVEPLARKKEIYFEMDSAGAIAPFVSDVDKLRQIIVNLAGNAIKFTDAGFVRITASDDGDSVCFQVIDSGIGISDEDLARLFQPFTQVDASLTRRHGGTGLGLYISNRLAGLLGGTITVSSKVGEGSTFSLRIPRQTPAPA
jgi:signal transduction histidine kinase